MQAMTQLGQMKELQKNGSMKDLTVFNLKNELEKYKQEKVCVNYLILFDLIFSETDCPLMCFYNCLRSFI